MLPPGRRCGAPREAPRCTAADGEGTREGRSPPRPRAAKRGASRQNPAAGDGQEEAHFPFRKKFSCSGCFPYQKWNKSKHPETDLNVKAAAEGSLVSAGLISGFLTSRHRSTSGPRGCRGITEGDVGPLPLALFWGTGRGFVLSQHKELLKPIRPGYFTTPRFVQNTSHLRRKAAPASPSPQLPPRPRTAASLPPSLRPPARRSASPDSGGGARGRGSPRPLPGGGDCGPRRRRRLCLPETGAHPGTPRPPSEREARPRPGGAGCPRRQTESGSAGHPPSAPGGASPAAGRPPGAGARPGQVPGGRRAPPPPRALASPGSMGALRPAAARGEARP